MEGEEGDEISLLVSHQRISGGIYDNPSGNSQTQRWLPWGGCGGMPATMTTSPSRGRGAGAGQEGRGALLWERALLVHGEGGELFSQVGGQ